MELEFNLRTATDQEVFNQASKGVMAQGALARLPSGKCAYFANVGGKACRCAVGHVLPLKVAQRFADAGVVVSLHGVLVAQSYEELSQAVDNRMGLLYKLQDAHDTAHDMAEAASNFKLLAERRGWEVPSWLL